MAVSVTHLFAQRSALAALGRVALRSITTGRGPSDASAIGALAEGGPWVEEVVGGPDAALTRAFIKNAGGDPGWYRGSVPVAMFAQWTFSAVSKALGAIPWPMTRVLNAGVSVRRAALLPVGVPLVVRARIARIDADDRRAKISTEVHTGTEGAPDALQAVLHTYLPFGKPGKGADRRPEPARSDAARELAFWRLSSTAGRDFAWLTGDLNPIHWVRPAAKMAGFRSVILHGFASMARAIEGLNRGVFVGDPSRLGSFEARFVRPLALPAHVGLYLDRSLQQCWIADGPSGPAYLSASYGVSP